MSGVRLHPKYGVNPTISQCFWCGKDKNELVLLGAASKRLTGHEEAPMHVVFDLDPCDTCKGGMAQGITFIEATEYSNKANAPAMKAEGKDIYPTGRWCVIKEEAVEHMSIDYSLKGAMLKTRKTFIQPEAWKALGLPEKDEG